MEATSTGFDFDAYLIDAYQGEILGEAFFALLAEREFERADAERWRLLERLERHVKGRLRAELESRGLETSEDPEHVETGRKTATALGAMPPADRWPALIAGLRGFVEQFTVARDATSGREREIAEFVLAHEEALLAFAEREAANESDPDAPVRILLEKDGAPEEPPLADGIRLTPLDDAYRDDPNPALRELLERAPVHRDHEFKRVVLTRHDDVERVLRDLSFWVDGRKAREDSFFKQFRRDDREPSMLSLDDPEHKRLRNLVSSSFTPRQVATWRPVVSEVARELVDAVEQQDDDEFDLVQALAAPLPAIAIARLLGVDPSNQADFKRWSEASVVAGFNPFASEEQRAAADRAQDSLDLCFREEIAKRRKEPSDDLIGKMVTAHEEGDRLSEQEIVTMCNLLLVAGNVTTSDLIGNGVKALLEHPSELEKLRAHPELLENAIEEMLRFDPPVTQSGRLAPRDVEIGGVPIRKGESITTVLAAANRDPAVYPDPERFDIARQDTHHQSFGGGAHLCLGAHLARLEAREAIGALVSRFPKLARSDRPFEYKRVPGFRGLAEYWLRRA